MSEDALFWKQRAEKLEAQNKKLRLIVDRLRPLHKDNARLREELKTLKSLYIGRAPGAPKAAPPPPSDASTKVPKKSLPVAPESHAIHPMLVIDEDSSSAVSQKHSMIEIDDNVSSDEGDDDSSTSESFELVPIGEPEEDSMFLELGTDPRPGAPRASWLSSLDPEELRQKMIARFGDKDLGDDEGSGSERDAPMKSPRVEMGITSGGIPVEPGARPRKSTLVLNKEEQSFLESSGPQFEAEEVNSKGRKKRVDRKGLGLGKIFASRSGVENAGSTSLRKTTSPRRSPRSVSSLRKSPRSETDPAAVESAMEKLAANLTHPPALSAKLDSPKSKHGSVLEHTSSIERLNASGSIRSESIGRSKKSWGRKKGSTSSSWSDIDGPDAVNVVSSSLMPVEMSRQWSTEMALQVEETGTSDLKLDVINALSLRKSIYYMLRVDVRESSWVVPRTAEQFKEFHALLKFKYTEDVPDFNPPAKLFKKVQEKTVRDRMDFLQEFLNALLMHPALVGSTELIQFMDPYYRPSPIALRAIQPVFEGSLQMKTDKRSVKSFKPFWFILKHDFYCFKSLDDEMPHDVISLEYTTIDIVKDSDYPRFCFSLTSLSDAETYYLAAETNRNLADWILALRTVKSQRTSYNVGASEPKKVARRDSVVVRLNTTQILFNSFLDMLDGKHTDESAFGTVEETPVVPPNPADVLSIKVEADPKRRTRTMVGTSKEKALYVVFDPCLTDVTFVFNFLCCFREWFEPALVFTVMARIFGTTDTVEVRQRIVYFLERWLMIHFYDFRSDSLMSRRLVYFLHKTLADPRYAVDKERLLNVTSGGKIRTVSVKKEHAVAALLIRDAPQSILPPVFTSSSFDFMDLAPLEVARQLTLLEHGFFARLESYEFLRQRWVGNERFQQAPHLTAAILRFNQVCGWVSSLIVSTRKPVPRIAILHRFIDIARCCMEMHNFNSVVAVMGGLQNNAVYRLKDTWEALPQDSRDVYEEMKGLLNNSGNFKNYRQKFEACAPPAVPYLGLLLTDLTFTEQGNPEYLDNGMINFKRVSQLGDIIAKIHKYQSVQYSLRPLPYVMDYLRKITPFDEEEQDRLSFLIRPRGAGSAALRDTPKVVWKEEYTISNTTT